MDFEQLQREARYPFLEERDSTLTKIEEAMARVAKTGKRECLGRYMEAEIFLDVRQESDSPLVEIPLTPHYVGVNNPEKQFGKTQD